MLELDFRRHHKITWDVINKIGLYLPVEDIIDLTYVFRLNRDRVNKLLMRRLVDEFPMFNNMMPTLPTILEMRNLYRILIGQKLYEGKYGCSIMFKKSNGSSIRFLGFSGIYQLSCTSKSREDLHRIVKDYKNMSGCIEFKHNCVAEIINYCLLNNYKIIQVIASRM